MGEPMTQKIFTDGPATDREFLHILNGTDERLKATREYIESLYSKVADFLDDDIPDRARREFHRVYWEMNIAAAMLQSDIAMIPKRRKKGDKVGPDIETRLNNIPFWFEAIAANEGTGDDKVVAYIDEKPIARSVDDNGVKLRIAHAINEKFKKYQDYLKKNVVSPKDGFVIAINGFEIGTDARLEAALPRIVKCVFGLGHEVVHFNPDSLKVVGASHQKISTIPKASGTLIQSECFLDPKYCGISAVIFSMVASCSYWPWYFDKPNLLLHGHPYVIVHNPLATVPLPRGFLKAGVEYWIDSDKLQNHDWSTKSA
jgi:hypothetical protein